MKVSDIPAILDTLNDDQIALFNKTTDAALKRYLDPEKFKDVNLHKEKLEGKDITYGDVFNTLTKEQRYALYFTIETALTDIKNN